MNNDISSNEKHIMFLNFGHILNYSRYFKWIFHEGTSVQFCIFIIQSIFFHQLWILYDDDDDYHHHHHHHHHYHHHHHHHHQHHHHYHHHHHHHTHHHLHHTTTTTNICVFVYVSAMAFRNFINIHSFNQLLPDGIKPLHEPVLTNHLEYLSLFIFIWNTQDI